MRKNRIVRIAVIGCASGFLLYYGIRNWADVEFALDQINPWLLGLAVPFVLASLFCKALVNVSLLKELLHANLSDADLIHSYTQSQVVRYIPGKIWGVMFQASSLQEKIRKGDVWAVNLYQLLFMNAITVLVLMIAILFMDELSVTLRWSIAGVGLLAAAVIYPNAGRIFRMLRLDSDVFRKYAALVSTKMLVRLFVLTALDWFFYIGMWYVLTYGRMDFAGAVVMAVNYATASFVGILVFFLPSGLVAREAAFIAFGRVLGENMSLLVIYSVVVRLIFLAGDFLLFVLTFIYKGRHGKTKEALG